MTSPRSELMVSPEQMEFERVEIMRARIGDSPSAVAKALGMPYEYVAAAFEAQDLVVETGLRLPEAMKQVGLGAVASATTEEGRRERVRELSRESKRRAAARETPEQRKARLAKIREYQRAKMAAETPEQREERLANLRKRDAEYRRRRRATETDEQYQARLERDGRRRVAARRRDALAGLPVEEAS